MRIHKFGELDVNVDKKTNITKYPSYLAMEELAANDRNVASAMSREKVAAAGEEFAGIVGDGDDSWLEQMDVDKRGVFRATYNNFNLIMRNDPKTEGVLRL